MATLVETFVKQLKRNKTLWPGVPEPYAEEEALYRTVSALKLGYEQLSRGRGRVENSALLVGEVAQLLPLLQHYMESLITEGGSDGEVPTDVQEQLDAITAALFAHINDKNNPHATTWATLLGKPSTFPPSPHTLDSHSDVATAGAVARESLVLSASGWVAEQRTTTFLQETQPTDANSSIGDLWLVT